MSDMLTFHKILAGCVAGDAEAWRAFLSEYTPIVLGLLDVYLPWKPEDRTEFWRESLGRLSANGFERLRAFSRPSDREFLVDLRGFVLDSVSTKIDPSQDLTSPPAPTVEALLELLKGLPLLHQEIVFLTLAGYSQATLEKILRISPGVAQAGLERLRAHCAPALGRAEDQCLWPAGWIAITHSARASGQQECQPLRSLVRILDGQASWYDKNPAEEHRSSCLHCLELWTSLLEVASWRREARPLPQERIEPLLSSVPLKAGTKPKKSLLARMLGQ